MANEPYITKTNLEEVTQKVTIENSKDIAKPLVDQQKKNDLKELEKSIEQKALFQDIAAGINGLGKSLIDGLKSLIPKTDGGLSKLLGLGLGLLLAPFVTFIAFIGQLGVELKFFSKLITKPLGFIFKPIIEWFKKTKFGKKIISVFSGITDKFKKLFKPVKDFFAKNKFIQKVVGTFKKLFSGGKGFFGNLWRFAKGIIKFATGGPFKKIIGFAGKIGRIMGKVFLPITILMGIFDFVKGFMKGYEEDGIIGGIKEGFNSLFEGLIGGLLRILAWIPTKIAEWLGLDNLAAAMGKFTETIIKSVKDVFGGLVDLVVAVFTWDTQGIKNSLVDIWKGVANSVLAPFGLIVGLVKDAFGGSIFDRIKIMLKKIPLTMASFFLYVQEGLMNFFNELPLLDKVPALGPWITKQAEEIAKQKKAVDEAIKLINQLEQGLKASDSTPTSSINSSNSSSSMANVNNVTYNINAPSDYSAAAMKFMTA